MRLFTAGVRSEQKARHRQDTHRSHRRKNAVPPDVDAIGPRSTTTPCRADERLSGTSVADLALAHETDPKPQIALRCADASVTDGVRIFKHQAMPRAARFLGDTRIEIGTAAPEAPPCPSPPRACKRIGLFPLDDRRLDAVLAEPLRALFVRKRIGQRIIGNIVKLMFRAEAGPSVAQPRTMQRALCISSSAMTSTLWRCVSCGPVASLTPLNNLAQFEYTIRPG